MKISRMLTPIVLLIITASLIINQNVNAANVTKTFYVKAESSDSFVE